MKRYKILLVFDTLNFYGGAEELAISTIEALSRNNQEIHLITSDKTDWGRIRAVYRKEIRVQKEYVIPLGFAISKTYRSLLIAVAKLIAKQRYDLIFNLKGDVIPFFWDNLTYMQTPDLLYLPSSNSVKGFDNILWKTYFAPFRFVCFPLLIRECRNVIVTNSNYSREKIARVLGRQTEVIHPPVDVGRYRRLLNTLDRENVVTVISRFAREKKLDLIPHIAKNVNGKFIVIGSSNRDSGLIIAHLKEEIRRFGVENKVILWPNASHADKINALSRSKVFLHLRNFEPFGIAIVEAMATGCIPVVHDSGGPKEFVPERWRYNNVEQAMDKIQKAFDFWSKSEAEKISKIANRFDEVCYQRRILEIINEIA